MNQTRCPACAARPVPVDADDCTPVTVAERTDGGWTAITASGRRITLPRDAVDPGLRLLRAGQRLHARTRSGTVVEAWLA